ncbi:MAG TPA: family 1 glycosylhydrolase, partial [Candidatus Limnocylindria bacterium]
GFNTYRFSVEWARIEPEDGRFDPAALRHYRRMVEVVAAAGLTPMVTLNHFTLPLWLARRGGWRAPEAPAAFARYCREVVSALGDAVTWYCTINEPGVVAFGGYLGAWGFPPGTRSLDAWEASIRGLIAAHRQGRAAVKEIRPEARVGATHSMQEWSANPAGRPVLDYLRRMNEDVFLEASAEDDFVGVQTYTRQRIDLPAPAGRLADVALGSRFGRRLLAQVLRSGALARVRPRALRRAAKPERLTQMGYEFWPEAVAATVRRAASLLPGRDIIVTEHGVATADDAERIEFIRRGLVALHGVMAEGLPLRGYVYWSALDNFEWARGYSMSFGLIGVDRRSMERSVKPSARFLGEVARSNRLIVPG